MNHDALFLAAHPDDAEICCGGTILRLVDAGLKVAIADMTRGEMGSRGDVATRQRECDAATRLLGVASRRNLELPDAALRGDDEAMVRTVVAEIRRVRPRLLFTQHETDIHPDHSATAGLGKRAFFLCGLAKYAPELGPAFRPQATVRFPANDHVEPTFCVDISDLIARKRAAIECYASQVAPADGSHFARKTDPLERCTVRDRYFGAQLGCAAAEPFVTAGALLVHDPVSLFGR